ncbi:MAG TPA: sugar-transfer associated ATP-grasp domain-containing protein [Patescibacteria group bacterium]|nr:sugar-transfer associated ATP-grasp domain-containing protein [Patescibacteria group bacterium]
MFDMIRKSRPILGMNARNLRYIRPSNFSRARHLADNKIFSKRVLKKNGIPVPALIAKISSVQMLEQFDWNILPQSFALKPNRGFGGEGIIVVYGKKKGRDDAWIKADGTLVTTDDLKNHIYNILEGTYSLANTPDVAFFEERMKLSKVFKPYVFKGIPDIRVIVYNKVPVMAMLRLPTKASGGKANLQQGAIGVGIDLASGTTTTAVQGKSKIIEYFPGTRLLLSGIKIPYWRDILTLAVKAQEVSDVGFLGADIAIDRDRGPVFLELNARPGLSIQIANLAGLKGRLERVQGLAIKTIERGVAVGMNLFGGEIESGVEEISGKKIIGTIEKVSLLGKDAKKVEVDAKIDTGAGFSSVDTTLARQLGFGETIDHYQSLRISYENIKNLSKDQRAALFKDIPDLADTAIIHSATGTTYRPMIQLSIILHGTTIPLKASVIDRSGLMFPIIIGKRDLDRFLIDASK